MKSFKKRSPTYVLTMENPKYSQAAKKVLIKLKDKHPSKLFKMRGRNPDRKGMVPTSLSKHDQYKLHWRYRHDLPLRFAERVDVYAYKKSW